MGILLGSIWAYYELGWGGFGFWDPVENVSLMPWLALITLLHCTLILEKKQILTSWVVILSIATKIHPLESVTFNEYCPEHKPLIEIVVSPVGLQKYA